MWMNPQPVTTFPITNGENMLHDFDVFGCDAGYYGVKAAFRHAGAIQTTTFPSIAVRVTHAQIASPDIFLGPTGKKIEVDIDGSLYAVETDAQAIPSSRVVRTETDNFPRTDEYAALVLAALASAGARRVSCLVLGLPLQTMQKHGAYLKARFTREHRIRGRDICKVEQVAVVPQPLGSLAFIRSAGLKPPAANMSMCIVDSGWHTCDSIVVNPGGHIDMSRSLGRPGGAAIVIREVARLIAEETQERIENIDRIDHSLRTKEPLWLHGRQIELDPFLRRATQVTYAIASAVLTALGTTEDLYVFGTGGAAGYYATALSETLGCPVQSLDRSQVANAIGFLLAGERATGSRR
jgi:plasmid segregation protein ParM